MALAAVGLFLIAYQWGNQYQLAGAGPPSIGGVLIRPPQPLPALDLSGPRGGLTGDDLLEHWTLIALASPAGAGGHRAVAKLIEVANRLVAEPDLRERLRLLLISADDAPRLARDFERLTPELSVLTGGPQMLERLRAALGAGPAQADAEEPPALYLIDPKVRLVALFPGAQAPAGIAADIVALDGWPGLLRTAGAGKVPAGDGGRDAPTDER